MKTRTFALMIFACWLMVAGCQEKGYRAGRDTFDCFGDGRFQILSRTRHVLIDNKTHATIHSQVTDYSASDDYLYVAGPGATYGVLNLATGEYRSYKSPDSAPAQWKNALSRLGSKNVVVFRENSFGGGRFQMLNLEELALYDCGTQMLLENNIQDYSKIGVSVYVLGHDKTYGILDLAAGKYHHYRKIDEAPANAQKRLSRLDKSWIIEFKKKWKIGY